MALKYLFDDVDRLRGFLKEYWRIYAVDVWNGSIAPDPEDLTGRDRITVVDCTKKFVNLKCRKPGGGDRTSKQMVLEFDGLLSPSYASRLFGLVQAYGGKSIK